MKLTYLPIFALFFYFLPGIQPLYGALFDTYYVGEPGNSFSDSLEVYLQEMGESLGIQITSLNAFHPEEQLKRGGILIALEDGLLKRINSKQQEYLENWLIGDANHSGGTLLILKMDIGTEIKKWSETHNWEWLEALVHPKTVDLNAISLQHSRPNYPLVSLANPVAPDASSSLMGSFVRELPHPYPQSTLMGGRVFYSTLLMQFPALLRDDQGNYIVSILQDHYQEALMWAVGLSDGSLLEVPFLEIEAEQPLQEARLDWVTASEKQNAHFEVQRSVDGKTWKTMEIIPTIGGSDRINYYSYLEVDLGPGFYYYRLRQVDQEEREYFSAIAALAVVVPDPIVQLYPNPARDYMVLKVSTNEASRMRYSIETIVGKVVLTEDWQASQQFFVSEIQVGQLPAGLYQLRVQTDQAERIKQFVKY